jgi:hypothetical protein
MSEFGRGIDPDTGMGAHDCFEPGLATATQVLHELRSPKNPLTPVEVSLRNLLSRYFGDNP